MFLKKVSMKKIFISHCQSDEPIVKPLVHMIHMACNLNRDDIFCTCIKGMGCSAGDLFSETIRNAFAESSIIVALLTKNYKTSEFCMAELGASWISRDDKVFIPLIDEDIDYDFFKGVLTGVSELKINDEFGLSQLCDKICDRLKKKKSFEIVRDSVNDYLKSFSTNKSRCPSPFMCTKDQWDSLENEKYFFKEKYEEACEVIDEKNTYIEKLEKLKDQSEVAALSKEMHQTDIDAFQECVDAVRSESSHFDRPVFKFVVYDLLGLDEPVFDEYDWSQLSKALPPRILLKNTEERYYVNKDNRHVKALAQAISTYIEMVENAEEEVRNYYSEKLDVDFDINNSEFNDKLLDL